MKVPTIKRSCTCC